MTVGVIVQARMTSTRLPGKVLCSLPGGGTVLSQVIRRCAQMPGLDHVICAVADGVVHDAAAQEAERAGAAVVRGPEDDVLARYRLAAERFGLDIGVRITSDCPLIDPGVCGQVLDALLTSGADYASNLTPRSFPQGLDCEAFRAPLLAEVAKLGLAEDREHVTPWFRRNPDVHRVNVDSGRPDLAELRWTLDYPEDLEFIRAVVQALPEGSNSMDGVLAVLAARPHLAAINASRRLERSVASQTSPQSCTGPAGALP